MFFKPVFSVREQSVNVSELTPVGTVLARVHATDADNVVDRDALSYRLADTFALPSASQPQRAPLQHQHQNVFAVDERTGAVLLRQTLDYERSAQHVLLVEAVDSARVHTATASLVVHVRNENDNPPAVAVAPAFGGGGDEDTLLAQLVAAAPTSGSTSSVVTLNLPENALEGTQVARLLARDPDLLSGVQCSLNDTLHFKLVSLTTQPSGAGTDAGTDLCAVNSYYTLQVTALAFDREALLDPIIHVNLTCTEVSSSSLEAQTIRSRSQPLRTDVDLCVLVWDVNDAGPEFEQSTYSVSVSENVPVGSLLLELRAHDRDADPSHSHVFYRLGAGALDSIHTSVPVRNWFAVDTNSGALVTHAALDREALTNIDRELQTQTAAQGTASARSSSSSAVLRLLVVASDGVDAAAGSAHSATATVFVHLQDVDDCVPKFERDRVALVVSESAPPGTLLGTFAASDCDVSPAFRSLQYSLSEDGVPDVQTAQSVQSSQHDAILKDTRSERFAVDANGTVTLLGALNYSRQQSHTLNLVALDTRNRGLLRIAVFVHPNDSSSSAISPVALLDAKDTRTPASGPAAPNPHQHQQQAPTGPEYSAAGQQSLRMSISLAIGCAAGVLLVALVLCALWLTVLQRRDDIFYICRCRRHRHRRSRERRARGRRRAGCRGAGPPQPKEGMELVGLRGAHAELGLGLGLGQVEDLNEYGDGDEDVDGEEEDDLDANENTRNKQEQHKSASRSASQQMHALYLLADDWDRVGALEEHRPLTRPSPSLRMEMSELFATGNRLSKLHIFLFSTLSVQYIYTVLFM